METLTSTELMERAGISRATLNNYIALGLLPRPEVMAPGTASRARRIGYFPAEALETLAKVRAMKNRGVSMDSIVAELGVSPKAAAASSAPEAASSPMEETKEMRGAAAKPTVQIASGGPKLTLLEYDEPAYLVNGKFELEWWNEAAESAFLDSGSRIANEMGGRSLFPAFFAGQRLRLAANRAEALRFHLSIAKMRLSKSALFSIDQGLDGGIGQEVDAIYDEVDPVTSREMAFTEVNLAEVGRPPEWYRLYAVFFREGTLFSYVPAEGNVDALVSLLSRRDLVIRDILRSRKPYLTQLAVLVADLEGSTKICAELPAEEYFLLINDIWDAMGAKLRTYYATHGKHVGDGLVYYFLPQPDCSHIHNAIRCAHEMRQTMVEVSRNWKGRKNWLNDLRLNIGLDEGEEWFGTYQTPTHLEFTVLGDTINRAARLSDFARRGTVWVSKTMMAKLSTVEREPIRFGIRHRSEAGEEVLVPRSYARISNLLNLGLPENLKFQDIAGLTVAELFDIEEMAR